MSLPGDNAVQNAAADAANREKIMKLREALQKDSSSGWEVAWQDGITPWDAGNPQPALVELLEKDDSSEARLNIPKSGKAIVPGCGRGYDALLLATKGFDTWGVDISDKAVDSAKAWLETQKDQTPTEVINRVSFRSLDFFNFEPPAECFDLAYDYTFFCALNPNRRKPWADQLAKILKPGGILITLMFPIDGDRPGGPPFSVDPDMYSYLLSSNFEQIYFAKPERSAPGHERNEMMAVWKRK